MRNFRLAFTGDPETRLSSNRWLLGEGKLGVNLGGQPIRLGTQTNSPTLSLTRAGHVLAVDWHVSDGLRIAPFLTQLPHFSCANTDDTLSGLLTFLLLPY